MAHLPPKRETTLLLPMDAASSHCLHNVPHAAGSSNAPKRLLSPEDGKNIIQVPGFTHFVAVEFAGAEPFHRCVLGELEVGVTMR